ncbi:hypothetical protein MA16_Dca000363 [Dendrobium catenatum]|uniref:DUF1421 domain-containing protein n=1 Tax=Dendrobium catenatum TaxID=906689 RepID=A0A2I0WTN1_9ASPA|nr:hypothetical protein MA16_Dca000363 [Dendrobium catenatum]
MASGGSATRSASARSFDFGSDDVLCSYDDYTPQMDAAVNGKRSESPAKDLHESRVGRPLTNRFGQPEEYAREDVISAIEKCMKIHTDNLTRNLEGISGRLTQLELYCFKLERSIGEFRADMVREQSEANLKLKSLEKHVHEVHRSIQIIRDKQELSETQKELAKLQLSQKEPTNSSHSPKSTDGITSAATEIKAHNDDKDPSNLQLALALPRQTTPIPDQNQQYKELPIQQPAPASLTAPPQDRYILNQANSYYTSLQPLPLEQQKHPFPQYHPQWPQPLQPQEPSSQSQAPRPQNPSNYARYSSNQPANTVQAEAYQGSSIAPPSPYIAIPHLPSHPSQQSNMPGYNAFYVIDGSRAPHPRHLPNNNVAAPQMLNNHHPYGEMIEKAINMGYPRDQVVGVVQGMGESGQPLDLNTLLDRLNAIASGGMRRPWSG